MEERYERVIAVRERYRPDSLNRLMEKYWWIVTNLMDGDLVPRRHPFSPNSLLLSGVTVPIGQGGGPILPRVDNGLGANFA